MRGADSEDVGGAGNGIGEGDRTPGQFGRSKFPAILRVVRTGSNSVVCMDHASIQEVDFGRTAKRRSQDHRRGCGDRTDKKTEMRTPALSVRSAGK